MKRLIKFLLGLAAGATVAALVTPKSGREMREQLLAGVSGRLLPSSQGPQTLLEEPAPTAAATAEPVAAEPGPELVSESGAEPAPWFRPLPEPPVEEPPAEEPVAEEPPPLASTTDVEAPVADDAGVGVWPEEQETAAPEPEAPVWNAGVAATVETPLYAEPPVEAVAEPVTAEVEDLRPRIEETRAAVESEIAKPFAPVEEPEAESEITQEFAPIAPEPFAEEPVVEEPVVEEPFAEEPVVEEPVVEEPLAEEPVVEEPVAEVGVVPDVATWEEPRAPEAAEPVGEEPAPWEEPGVAEVPLAESAVPPPLAPSPFAESTPAETYTAAPIYEAAAEPAVEEAPPRIEEPGSAWEAYEEPAPEPSTGAWAPEAASLVAETGEVPSLVEEPLAEAPVAQEPVVEEPVAEAPVAEAPVAEEPVADAPVVEAPPVGDEPGEGRAIDQAEMRRRIEETRARLKAKAFDAMMSGEAALLSRDSGEKPVPEGTVQLDSEASAQVDEGLSPDDS